MKSGPQPRDILRKFPGACKNALDATADRLENEFTTQITKVQWPWESAGATRDLTARKNGTEVTEPRNIVDLGDLRRSQTRTKTTKTTVEWEWQVDYSTIVHEGAQLKSGSYVPPRRWTKSAEKEVKPLEYFTDILERELNG